MFAKLKAQATSAASAAAEQATKAATDLKQRVDTGVAGKKLLDEGGEGMKLKLLAKKATQDAGQLDTSFSMNGNRIMGDYVEAAAKMQAAAALPGQDAQAFATLATAYTKRAAELGNVLTKLTNPPGQATISLAETDAITILVTKMRASGVHQTVRSSFSKGDGSAAAAEAAPSNDVAGAPSEAAGAPAEKKGMLDSAKEKAQQLADRAKERAGNANAGMELVNKGGDDMVTILLAKKASIETTAADSKNIDILFKCVDAYRDAEAKLKEALPQDTGAESPPFSTLLSTFGPRCAELQAMMADLSPVPQPIETHESESDAIVYLSTQMGIKKGADSVTEAAVKAQGQIAEKTMSAGVSGATGGRVTSVPEGSGDAAVKYAKENPEQAKAAMSLAADAAKASGGKGGGGYS